jgi:hypothetical protein
VVRGYQLDCCGVVGKNLIRVESTGMLQGPMRAEVVIVFQVSFENLVGVPFMKHDDSVQALTPNT